MAEIEFSFIALTTVITFVAGFILALLVAKKRKDDARLAAAISIINELTEIQTVLNEHVKTDEQLKKILADVVRGNVNLPLFHILTAAYEGVLYSGVFRDFDKETQRNIAIVYEVIQYANILERKSLDFIVIPLAVTPAFFTSLSMYLIAMNNVEKDLQTQVAQLLTHMRGRFARQ